MEDKKSKSSNSKLGVFIIANSIVWGAAMVGISFTLKGSGYMERVLPILASAAAFSVVILPSILIRKKPKAEE